MFCEAGAIFSVRDFIYLVGHPLRRAIVVGVFHKLIDGGAVGICDDGDIIRRFGPALYLKARDARSRKAVDMLYEAEVLGVEDICTPVGLLYREIRPLAGLLHKGIAPAAGLRALSPVGVAAG